jgi:DNA-binding MarR family transcriptional regulator/ribosomal protein S18 acetylase RimI-like enzyme
MDAEAVAQVRRFNRVVTGRVGALDDHFLSRDRSLGAARLLWEIGTEGCDLRSLRARLGLDSGYLSRLVRSLERDGLVVLEPDESDRRVNTARLTPEGVAEREVLDRRSDELAESLLAPLSGSQRERLVTAMSDVERLLTAGMVQVEARDPADPQAQHCLREYALELDRRFATGFDVRQSRFVEAQDMRPPKGLVLVASMASEPVGCGVLRFHDGEPTEIKRLWIAPSARGLGLGRRLLSELEARAVADGGSPVVRLDTNAALSEAIAMYRSSGYTEVPRFNDERYADHWFEKRISDPAVLQSG